MKDKLFIFVAAVLVILFTTQIFSNLPREVLSRFTEVRSGKELDKDITELLKNLEEADLKPWEAKYYRIINE